MLKKWIEALRSGKYEQTKNRLVRVDGEGNRSYCCLGVACVLAGLEEVCNDGEYGFASKLLDGQQTIDEANIPFTLHDVFPTLLCKELGFSVMRANDSYKLPFPVIADLLESIYLGDGTKAKEILEQVIGTSVNLERLHAQRDDFLRDQRDQSN